MTSVFYKKVSEMTPEELLIYREKRREYYLRYKQKNSVSIRESRKKSALKLKDKDPTLYKKKKSEKDKRYREKYSEILKKKKAEYYLDNKESISERASKKYKDNPEKAKQRARTWRIENRDRHNASCMQRYLSKIQAVPPWLSEFMQLGIAEFYSKAKMLSELTGVPHEVDHIVPIRGKLVCGLHVPWNLQVITESANCSKKNKIIEEAMLLSREGVKWLI